MAVHVPGWARRTVGFDTETTGTDENARIIEFGAVVWEDGLKVVSLTWLLNPGEVDLADPNIRKAFEVNQIDPDSLKDKPTFAQVFDQIRHALGQADVRVAHNAPFDQRMMRQEFQRAVKQGLLKLEDGKAPGRHITLDTLAWDLVLHPDARGRSLAAVAERWGVSGWEAHRAAGDAEAAARILQAMAPKMPGCDELADIQALAQRKWQAIMDAKRARDAQNRAR